MGMGTHVHVDRATNQHAAKTAGVLSRKCACEGPAWGGEKCDDCQDKPPTLARQAVATHDFSRIPVHPPAAPAIPTGYAISQPGDALEKDADRVAERVMHAPAVGMPPTGTGPRSHRDDASETVPSQLGVAGPGARLPEATRSFMESRFGMDFSKVRIHTDAAADRSADSVQARAYTVGNHIVFRGAAYDPESSSGRRLIAHELAHTVQHTRGGGATRVLARQPERPSLEWVDGQIALVMQQLAVPILPPQIKGPLQLRLFELQRLRATAVPTKAVTAPSKTVVPRKCPPFGNRTPDPTVIEAKLVEMEGRKFELQTDVANPGTSTTYEQIVPELYQMRLLKIQLLNCAVSLAPRSGSETTKAEADYAARAQEKLNQEARELAEEQYKRKQLDWDDLSHDERVAHDLQEYAGVLKRVSLGSFRAEKRVERHPMISTIENELYKNPRAQDIYRRTYWDLDNQPEEPSRITKFIHGVCENLAPCIDNLEQYRACVEKHSVNECRTAGLFRIGLNAIPSEGPRGPITRGPSGGAGGPTMPFGKFEPVPSPSGEAAITMRRGTPVTDVPVIPIPGLTEKPKVPPAKPIDEPPVTTPPTPKTDPAPKQTTKTKGTPDPSPDVYFVPPPRPDTGQRRKCVGPTGLSPQDPIPIAWFKPRHDSFYPPRIVVERRGTRGVIERDDPGTKLPDGTPVGVRDEFWPRIGKVVQLLPEKRTGKQSEYKRVLAEWGFDWKTMQPDHVLDIDWHGPDVFGNLWPYETSTNLSAGASQNVNQVISYCHTPEGPQFVAKRLGTFKRMLHGRYFVITQVRMHS